MKGVFIGNPFFAQIQPERHLGYQGTYKPFVKPFAKIANWRE
jgi:hypothetical protein